MPTTTLPALDGLAHWLREQADRTWGHKLADRINMRAWASAVESLEAALAVPAQQVNWEPVPEDARERAQFDRAVEHYGDVRLHIAQVLNIWAAVHPGGSYAGQCHIMANEVAKLALPAPPGTAAPSDGVTDAIKKEAE